MTTLALEQVDGLPRFSQITPDQVKPAVTKAIEDCKQTIEAVVASGDYSYANVVSKIDEADDVLGKVWSPVSHMNSVVSSDELREAHDACLPLFLKLCFLVEDVVFGFLFCIGETLVCMQYSTTTRRIGIDLSYD